LTDDELSQVADGDRGEPPQDSPPEEGDGTVTDQDQPGVTEPAPADSIPAGFIPEDRFNELNTKTQQLQSVLDAFMNDPKGFVNQNPTLKAIFFGDQVAPTTAPAKVPGIPQPFANEEAAMRAEEDRRLEALRNEDLDRYESERQTVAAERAGRRGYYNEAHKSMMAGQERAAYDEAERRINDFAGEYGKADDRPDGLSDEQVGQVVQYAIQSGITDLEAAYLKMNKNQILQKARIDASQASAKGIEAAKSVTSAGDVQGKTVDGQVTMDQDWLDNLSDEDLLKLTPQQQEELGILI
jgi:hypothetical protein